MTRHITDHRDVSTGAGLRHFQAAGKRLAQEGQHPAVQQVMRRPAVSTESKRLIEYTRIEKGQLA